MAIRIAVLRRRFLAALWRQLAIVWPIVTGLIAVQTILGLLVGFVEQWSAGDAIYFAFVTGLTIGYGDLVPSHFLSRVFAMMIGVIGVLITGVVAALGVRALDEASTDGTG